MLEPEVVVGIRGAGIYKPIPRSFLLSGGVVLLADRIAD
jgi:hypothetical protein